MKKRNILRSLAIVAVLGSPSATAVELSFGFPIELTQGTCGGLLSCGPFGQIYQAAVFVTLNVMDPFSNQSWTYAAGGVSYALTAPFPIMAPPLCGHPVSRGRNLYLRGGNRACPCKS